MSKTIALLLVAFSLSAAAQDNRQVTSTGDLVGCWSKVDFTDQAKSKINEIDYREARYQVFCFEPDGTLRTVDSTIPIQGKSAELRAAFAELPKVIAYQVTQPGIVVLVRKDPNQTTGWVSTFTQRDMQFDGKSIPKDTLTMGLIDVAKQRAVHWRYLVKIPE
ncbi:hypothetical protein [Polaromonas sp. A23]|uniref:hypothetical protein n=1 Tax=Polaromonas sp. A23 TaxID=1944133 RepID=UPI000985BB3C|nr:hypothetical protein [Polaromonas sp. A23]OOG47584.1 hypothetical protein B0B52_01135 [Polaromonas sp. A23]